MNRLVSVDPATATGEARPLLDAVQGMLGTVPNFVKVLATAPKALGGYLQLSGNLRDGLLDPATQERLALAVGEANACRYCVSAHAAIGREAGLDAAEMAANRAGTSGDARAAAALAFARLLVDNRGDVTSTDIRAVRQAGLGDGEIVEIIAHVALNILTNYLGKVAQIEIDFPEAGPMPRAT
jgi:uncharacterized peroxidase-related enzyme